jgi:tetratricopeptide (TPR) repeat protein
MKVFLRLICLLIFWEAAGGGVARAQSNQELAQAYFKNNECEKAIAYFKKVLDEEFNRPALKNYTHCVMQLKGFSDAEQFFKKQIKANTRVTSWYYMAWGTLLDAESKPVEADKRFELALDAAGNSMDQKREIAEEFRSMGKHTMASKAYLDIRTFVKRNDLFQLELASIYRDLNESEKMIEELLAHGTRYQNKEVVQNMLQDFIKNEKDEIILEKVLYERIQKFPNESFYNELLIWFQVQKKDFYKAFIQERALDKRFNNEGSRLYNLGMLAIQNHDYKVSTMIFEYVAKEYPQGQYYHLVRRLAIFSREEELKSNYPIKREDVITLISQYQNLVDELGVGPRSVEAIRNIGLLYAFYLDDFDKAIQTMELAIKAGEKNKSFVDKCKLDLGDIYLLQGEPWEATLVYSQVEKSQKDDLLGYEAKLKNAKLHYFMGEFELSKALLDILKKATSREIANDANELSLKIMDNTGLDSTELAMKSFAHVELLIFQNKLEEAIDSLKMLKEKYMKHSLSDEILWQQANTHLKLDHVQDAIQALEQLKSEYGTDILGDDASFMLAKIYEEKLKDKTTAMKLYGEVMEKYPGSIYVVEARKRFRLLRGDTVN